jgi:hypothetical protein
MATYVPSHVARASRHIRKKVSDYPQRMKCCGSRRCFCSSPSSECCRTCSCTRRGDYAWFVPSARFHGSKSGLRLSVAATQFHMTNYVGELIFLPAVATGEGPQPFWQVILDSGLARYLRADGEPSRDLLVQKLSNAVESKRLQLLPVQSCGPEDPLDVVLQGADGLPRMVVSPVSRQLLGILTPFDLL